MAEEQMSQHSALHYSNQAAEAASQHTDWITPRPQPIPPPTYMPITVAIGGTCVLWGFLTSFIVSIVGIIFFVFGIIGWSGELWHGK